MKRRRADGADTAVVLLSDSEDEAEAASASTHVRPAAKRAKESKKAAPMPQKAAKPKPTAKQTTLKSKGFGMLCFSASQGADDAGSPQQPPASKRATMPPLQQASAADHQFEEDDVALWADKHEPKTAEELAMHKAKVNEVKSWLEGYLAYRKSAPSRVLLITGPVGCGKSATVRALAADLGFDLVEWTPPVPTLWSEHQYQNGHDMQYQSKLDDFESFVARSKFATLQLSASTTGLQGATPAEAPGSSQRQSMAQQASTSHHHAADRQQHKQQRPQDSQPQAGPLSQAGPPCQPPAKRLKLLLVDDVPYVADAERRQRLIASLRDLATTSRCPVVIVSTEAGGGSGGGKGGGGAGGGMYGAASGHIKGLHKDLLSTLEALGASTITFNPLTALNTAKALKRIAEAEGVNLTTDMAAAIAAAAAGDLRNAIATLQMGFGGTAAQRRAAKAKKPGKAAARKRGRSKKGSGGAEQPAEGAASASHVARDQNLHLFHALGKILHAKREPTGAGAAADDGNDGDADDSGAAGRTGDASTSAVDGQPDRPSGRGRLRCDPDAVVQQSALEATTIAAFLHENYPHFISDGAIDDTADAASYLSDAVLLAWHRSSATTCGFWDEDDAVASTLQEAAAASVAARGLLYANAHPAPSRWLPLRGPAGNAVERAAATNAARLSDALRTTAGFMQCTVAQGSAGHVAAHVLPFLRLLAACPSHAWLQRLLPSTWSFFWNGSVSQRTTAPNAGGDGGEAEELLAVQQASLGADEAAANGGELDDEIEDE